MVPVSNGHGRSESVRLYNLACELSTFRSRLCGCFGRCADALFELAYTILYAGMMSSAVHLSLAVRLRRGVASTLRSRKVG